MIAPELQLHVPATASFGDRRLETLKAGTTFAVFDDRGDSAPGGSDGLYHDDTRIVSRFEVLLEGVRPLLLSSDAADDNASFSADLTSVDRYDGDRLVLARELIHLNRRKFVYDGALYERILVHNYDDRAQDLKLDFVFDADFADVFEVRGTKRERRGDVTRTVAGAGAVRYRYRALDGVESVTQIAFDPAPQRLEGGRASFDLHLEPGGSTRVFARAGRDAGVASWHAADFYAAMRSERRSLRAQAAAAPRLASSNATFDAIAARAFADLWMLVTETPQGPYPFAGIPWFATPFGRDGIITALFSLWFDPRIARGVLRFLAATQATAVDPSRDAEPGKILHEMRSGEMARLREVPFGRYYGSVDATPLFIVLAGAYFDRTGDAALVRELWPNVEAALAWLDTYGDLDGDGFIEYERKTAIGLENQGWKDSHDAIFHEDGTLATTPIALCEVQAYAFAARVAASKLARVAGDTTRAEQLAAAAERMRVRFEEQFWCEDLGTYALALDGDKRPCRVVASNAGHALFGGIASPERAARVAKTLLGTASFSGWGIRTVARNASRYNPMSYHNGSVWPHDNAMIALGLARYGHKAEVARLCDAMFAAAGFMELRRLPELFCGFSRRAHSGPTLYPVACSPQAWATAAPFAMLAASLGLQFASDTREIRFDHPVLPGFLSDLSIAGLRLGDAVATVNIRRRGNALAVSVPERHGEVRITAAY